MATARAEHAFQSTRPARGATRRRRCRYVRSMFQSTRPARGATHHRSRIVHRDAFQSTRPARGATRIALLTSSSTEFQSTRPARGATRQQARRCRIGDDVSIHAPRAGRDDSRPCSIAAHTGGFNPRAPRGARPSKARNARCRAGVSIHAPRAGRDAYVRDDASGASGCFNPRAPRGARLADAYGRAASDRSKFQSTRPARGATTALQRCMAGSMFQSTRPARGATQVQRSQPLRGFQSTRPARGATALLYLIRNKGPFPPSPRTSPAKTKSEQTETQYPTKPLFFPITNPPPRTSREFAVRFPFALLTQSAPLEDRMTPSPRHAPPGPSIDPPESRTANYPLPV